MSEELDEKFFVRNNESETNSALALDVELAERCAQLRKRRRVCEQIINIAERKIASSKNEILEIDEQLEALDPGFYSPFGTSENSVLPSEVLNTQEQTILGASPFGKGDTIPRRGAMSAKEKEARAKEEAEKLKQEKENAQAKPGATQDPDKPVLPGQGKKPDPNQPMTPEQKKEFLTKKLIQKDPRQQKEAIKELKKPENKDLFKEFMQDKEFAKIYKNAETMVGKYDKIQTSLRKSLKSLMQSSSDVVKMRIADLRSGKIGAAVVGFKEIASSASFGNEVARAANNVVKGVKELYKLFDIKPEEALNKELLEEARPLFTRQGTEKSKWDRDIDLTSRQNKVWGETKEITDEERAALKKAAEITGTDKLPSISKKDDMARVKEIVQEVAQTPNGKMPIAALIAKGAEK